MVGKGRIALILGVIAGLVIGGLIGYSLSPAKEVKGTEVTVNAKGDVIWMLPGRRALDPEVFGTPDNPLKTNLLPLEMRGVSEDGRSFTTTTAPGPFSNNVKKITGEISLSVRDMTPTDTPASKDEASMVATFTDPSGKNTYRVVLEKLIPVGPEHQFFGGVGTDVYMHGTTEIGTPLMPSMFSYVTLWGYGDIYLNGKLVDSKRVIHLMVTERLRDDNFKLGFEPAKPSELEIHLILPPTKVTPDGPVDSPVPTGFTLPNGVEQPFIHVNFYGVSMDGDKFL